MTHEGFRETKNPIYLDTEKADIALLVAFENLVELNIPSVWQIIHTEEDDMISLELWVFWFDERHTSKIDDNSHLKKLTGRIKQKKKLLQIYELSFNNRIY